MTECVLWTGATQGRYGQRRVNGKVVYVHRQAWEDVHGPIPEGLTIDHLCRVKLCINVAHMEVVTRAENGRRGTPPRTVCPNAHVYAEVGFYRNLAGHKRCKACVSAAQRRARLRRKAHANRGPGVPG